MRIKHKVNVRVAEDTDMSNLLFAPKDDLAEVVIDTFEKMTSGLVSVAPNTTESLALGDVAQVRGIYLRVDADCQVLLNNSSDRIQLRRPSNASGSFAKFFIEAEIDQVDIIAGATTVKAAFCIWGDASV